MSQNSTPLWLTVVLGGSGFVGVATILLSWVKHVKEGRREEIARLESDHQRAINRLQQDNYRLKQELSEAINFRHLLEENVEEVKKKGATEKGNSNLRRIADYLGQWQSSQELLNSSRNAAKWVENRRVLWREKIGKAATKRYSSEIPSGKRDLFEQDLSKYLDWLYESLNCGMILKFTDYVDAPAIDSPFPYRHAFRCLYDMRDVGDLTSIEIEFLLDYIDELNHFLQKTSS